MIKEEKQLLLQDLCARLPYYTELYSNVADGNWAILTPVVISNLMSATDKLVIKPYLRSMSSMTKEEKKEFSKFLVKRYCEEDLEGHISTSYCIEIDNVYTDDEDGIKYPSTFLMDAIDWLNAHHFDYRGLIEKGLALEAPNEIYNNQK